MMIDGITILDTTSVWICNSAVLDILAILAAICSVLMLMSLINSDEAAIVIFFTITFIILSCSAGIVYKIQGERVSEYKVTISDTVSFKDLYEKYEIVKQEGEIYTIREKPAKNS